MAKDAPKHRRDPHLRPVASSGRYHPDYATPMWRYLWDASHENPELRERLLVAIGAEAPAKEPSKKGRPVALTSSRIRTAKQRHLGRLLEAIAEVNTQRPRYDTISSLAGLLVGRGLYRSERTARRDVSKAMQWLMNVMKETPRQAWHRIYGIDPPSKMTSRNLRLKALENLGRQLLAKKT